VFVRIYSFSPYYSDKFSLCVLLFCSSVLSLSFWPPDAPAAASNNASTTTATTTTTHYVSCSSANFIRQLASTTTATTTYSLAHATDEQIYSAVCSKQEQEQEIAVEKEINPVTKAN